MPTDASYQTVLWLKECIKQWENGLLTHDEIRKNIKEAEQLLDHYQEEKFGSDFGELQWTTRP